MQTIRRYHHYLGLFFAPAILLFALSGALQTFRLQEEKGYGGTPPGWIVWMASVHKDSRLPRAKPPRAEDHKPAAPKAAPRPAGKAAFTLPMKVFVALLSAGLILSTLLGIVIALNNAAMRKVSILMLAAGTVVPLALLML
ncbi:MAG: hypothetical protein V4574_13140 [Pseudomonadota bacterium]